MPVVLFAEELEAGEKPGYVGTGDLCILTVCPKCCQQNPQIHSLIPKQLTYHDMDIDWWEELDIYAEVIQKPGLRESIEKEI